MIIRMSVSEEICTHEYLWVIASLMLEESLKEANLKKVDSFYFRLSALLMSYMTFEAFINFSGYILFPEIWENEKDYFKGKGDNVEAKISKLIEKLTEFEWKKGERPYQSIRNLRKFRDTVVHGKVNASNYEALMTNDGSYFKFKHDWNEFTTEKKVKESMDDIKSFCQSLVESMRKKSDHLHLMFNAFEGSLGSANGEPA